MPYDKNEALFGHQIAAAKKRYGFDLSPNDIKAIVSKIRAGQGVCLFKQLSS